MTGGRENGDLNRLAHSTEWQGKSMRAFAGGSQRLTLLLGAGFVLFCSPVLAVDVQFRLIPRLTPSSSDVSVHLPPPGVSSIGTGIPWTLEIWGSDLQDGAHGATGLVAAYVNVFFNADTFTTAAPRHSPLFPAFLGTEPTVNLPGGSIKNLGGVIPGLSQPRGIGPEWARIGWIEYGGLDLARPALIHITGGAGTGGVGCYGRNCGDVQVLGADVTIVPDMPSGVALMIVLTTMSRVRCRVRGGLGVLWRGRP